MNTLPQDTKFFYLVRHGESEANVSDVWLDNSASLTEGGRQQAELVKKRLEDIPIDHIISSPTKRARETAEIINIFFSTDIEFSELFVEKSRPSETNGMKKNGPEWNTIMQTTLEHAEDPTWHFSDEENYIEMIERGKKALKYLRDMPHQHTLVVTHGLFLRTLFALLTFKNLWATTPIFLYDRMALQNTGVTIFAYLPGGGWLVLSWNDYAHLPA